MIENSKDILYIVISFCIIWATVFLCWMFYYAGRILKNTNQIIEEFRVRLQALSEAISYIQEKVESMSFLMSTAMKGAGTAVKDIIKSKAKTWMEKKSDDFNRTAKEAVDKAVDATAAGMKKAANRIKK
ncbi:MAG: hypothetical protein NTW66_00325 [Candidatus Magasanikbacteria bacterium]|nr:hypothetical protein [Candidatus Magasanikbacteria bacterium]